MELDPQLILQVHEHATQLDPMLPLVPPELDCEEIVFELPDEHALQLDAMLPDVIPDLDSEEIVFEFPNDDSTIVPDCASCFQLDASFGCMWDLPPSEAIHWCDEILMQLQQAHSHDCNFRIDLIHGEDCSGRPLFIFAGSPKRKSNVMTEDGEPSPVSNQANLHLIAGVNPHHTEEIFTHPDRL